MSTHIPKLRMGSPLLKGVKYYWESVVGEKDILFFLRENVYLKLESLNCHVIYTTKLKFIFNLTCVGDFTISM